MSTTNQDNSVGLRICVVSNYYPPFFIGGYELGCKDIVEALKDRGHEIRVLTSTYGLEKPEHDGEVYRWLRIGEWWIPNSFKGLVALLTKERANLQAFKRLCRHFQPHLVYVWNPVGISLSVVSVCQQLGLPVCYFVSDYWLGKWETDPGYAIWQRRAALGLFWKGVLSVLSAIKVARSPTPPELRNIQFASECIKRQARSEGKLVSGAKVIHWGVDTDALKYTEKSICLKRLLYVGQVVPHKGVHTAIEAVKLLIESGHTSTMLTIAGGSVVPQYEAEIRRLIASLQLEKHVYFTGQVPRERLLSIYNEHDILIFPSIWAEPFSITLLEAMASGLAAVATPTGGSTEILQDGVNALVFQKENAQDCAACVARLFGNNDLFSAIRRNARRTVEQKHNINLMVDRIESSLREALQPNISD